MKPATCIRCRLIHGIQRLAAVVYAAVINGEAIVIGLCRPCNGEVQAEREMAMEVGR